MDLKSRGQRGRSFIQRAITRSNPVGTVSSSNTAEHEDEELAKKVEALFSQDLLFERLHTEPRIKRAYAKSIHAAQKSVSYVKSQKLTTKIVVLAVLSVGLGVLYRLNSRHLAPKSPAVTTVAGAKTNSVPEPQSGGSSLPKEAPEFALLMPQGRKFDEVDVLRVSPAGNEPVYVFLDTLEGVPIKVSEQKVPKTFDYNRPVELERVAKDFQATNIIQIDGDKIYHGLNEKTDVQSLVFIKSELLVTISSSKRLPDDTWTGYILSLKKY